MNPSLSLLSHLKEKLKEYASNPQTRNLILRTHLFFLKIMKRDSHAS